MIFGIIVEMNKVKKICECCTYPMSIVGEEFNNISEYDNRVCKYCESTDDNDQLKKDGLSYYDKETQTIHYGKEWI
jgi:hypothetical protein